MRTWTLVAAFLVALFMRQSTAYCQGKITWDTGYPKTGANVGEVYLKGTLVPDKDWEIDNTNGAVSVIIDGGGEVLSGAFTIDIKTGAFSATYPSVLQVRHTGLFSRER